MTEMKGILTISGGRLVVVPVATEFTDEEVAALDSEGVTYIGSEESLKRRVLCDYEIDLDNILRKHVGYEVQVLLRHLGPGLTLEESERNLLAVRPNDVYVHWSTRELPFVCLEGLNVHEHRASAVAYGTPSEKLARLDDECMCLKKPHRYVFRKNRVSVGDLEDLITRVLVDGKRVHE